MDMLLRHCQRRFQRSCGSALGWFCSCLEETQRTEQTGLNHSLDLSVKAQHVCSVSSSADRLRHTHQETSGRCSTLETGQFAAGDEVRRHRQPVSRCRTAVCPLERNNLDVRVGMRQKPCESLMFCVNPHEVRVRCM